MPQRRQCRRPSSSSPTAASQRSQRCSARQLRQASTRARPVMFDTHTTRSPGVRSRSISGEVTSERFHGSSSDRSTMVTVGHPARSRDRGGWTTPCDPAWCTTAVSVGCGRDQQERNAGAPASLGQHVPGMPCGRPLLLQRLVVFVEQHCNRQAPRTAPTRPTASRSPRRRRPAPRPSRRASWPPRVRPASAGSRAAPPDSGTGRPRAPSPTDAGRTPPPTARSASHRRAAGVGARHRPRRRHGIEHGAASQSPATSARGPGSCDRDVRARPTWPLRGNAVTRNGRIRPPPNAPTPIGQLDDVGVRSGAGDLRGSASGDRHRRLDGVGAVAEGDASSHPPGGRGGRHAPRADLHRRFEMFGNEVVERLVETRHVGQDSGDQQPELSRPSSGNWAQAPTASMKSSRRPSSSHGNPGRPK